MSKADDDSWGNEHDVNEVSLYIRLNNRELEIEGTQAIVAVCVFFILITVVPAVILLMIF